MMIHLIIYKLHLYVKSIGNVVTWYQINIKGSNIYPASTGWLRNCCFTLIFYYYYYFSLERCSLCVFWVFEFFFFFLLYGMNLRSLYSFFKTKSSFASLNYKCKGTLDSRESMFPLSVYPRWSLESVKWPLLSVPADWAPAKVSLLSLLGKYQHIL